MEVIKKQLQEMEAKSMRLEKELGFFKAKEQKSGQHKGKDTLIAKKNLEQPKKKTPESSTEPIEEREVLPTQGPKSKESTPARQPSQAKNNQKRNYASVAASKPAQAPENPWTQVVYKNRKTNSQLATKSAAKIEHQGRRILFPREVSDQQKSEADLMLALNEALQKAGEGLDTRFSRVRYAPSGAISALLTEKADAGSLIPRLSNLLIRAAKTVDCAVVGCKMVKL